MDKQFLCLDSPTDFMVGKYISADELKEFINIPCKIKAGVFILCMEGQIRSTINMSELTTSKLNVVTLLPNSRIQIHEISPDILIYFIAFSFDFMCYTNFIKSTMGYSTDDLQDIPNYKNIPKQGQPDHELLRASLSICRISRYLEQ